MDLGAEDRITFKIGVDPQKSERIKERALEHARERLTKAGISLDKFWCDGWIRKIGSQTVVFIECNLLDVPFGIQLELNPALHAELLEIASDLTTK